MGILLTDGNNLIATQQGRDLATRPVITLSPSVLTELARKGGDKERLTATVQLTTPEGKVLSAVTPKTKL
jgi:hypothetical protein